MTDAVSLALDGTISPEVAISRLLLDGLGAAEIAATVERGTADRANPRGRRLVALVEGRTAQLDSLAAEIRIIGRDHTALASAADVAAFFDHAVAHSPAAGVALHSLGDEAILEAATAEILAWIDREGLVPPHAAVLDLGCGTGRIAAALAPRCASVLGLDVSAGMIAAARLRHGAIPGLRFEITAGTTLPDDFYDLVLLVDSMPYILHAGLADAATDAVAARLRPHGALAMLNISYGRTGDADLSDARRWAAKHRWSLTVARPFALWDGAAFLMRAGGGRPRPG